MLVNTPGALTLESGTGICRGHDPFFQASRRSLNLPSMRRSCALHHLNFKKILHFQLILARISALKTQIFQMFVSKTPIFYFFLFFF